MVGEVVFILAVSSAFTKVIFASCPKGQFNSGSGCKLCHCHSGTQVCDSRKGCMSGHCAFGYKGMPYCQTPCPPRTFGIDCSSICHCPYGDTCSQQNGLCHSKQCLYKWTGPSCQKRLPEMLRAPTVKVISSEDVVVTWDKWSTRTGIGHGPIAYYKLQYNKRGEIHWETATTILENPKNQTYSFTVKCLQPETMYSFRLVLAMAMGDKHKLSLPSPLSAYIKTFPSDHYLPVTVTTRIYSGFGEMGQKTANTGTSTVKAPTDVTLMSKTTQSLSLYWRCATASSDIGYQIGVQLEESYTNQEITGENIVYTTSNTNYEIYFLQPASKYKITITAFERSTGKASSPVINEFWTLADPLPHVQNPTILKVTNETMQIEIYALNHTASPISEYTVIVEDITNNSDANFWPNSLSFKLESVETPPLLDYYQAKANGFNYYVTLKINASDVLKSGTILNIGNNSTTNNIWNAPLKQGLKYLIWVAVTSELDGVKDQSFTRSLQYAIPGVGVFDYLAAARKKSNKAAIIATAILLPLLFLIIVVLVILYFISKRNKEKADHKRYEHIRIGLHKYNLLKRLSKLKAARGLSFVTSTPVRDEKEHLNQFHSTDEIDLEGTGPEIRVPKDNGGYTALKKSVPVLCKELSHYYKKHSAYTITDEFKHLPNGVNDMVHVALNPENHSFNRSVRSLAYDTNRVRLIKSRTLDNDYINASKVKTHMHKFYIVTQTPMENTMRHFWKMVWEQNVDTVVMLMELQEVGKKHYEQYWPPIEAGSVLYGDIEVKELACTLLAHYNVRWIELSMVVDDEKEVRHVAHFQYKTWTDSNIPHHPIIFIDFLRRVHDIHQESSNIVVHCQLGSGRSGMFVAIDTLMYEGKVTGKVDVAKCVTVLRTERPFLVKTLQQYQFIFEALIEAFHYRDTRLEGGKFEFTYENMLSISSSECRSIIATEFDLVVSNQEEPTLNKSFKWTEYSTYVSPIQQISAVSKTLPNQSILEDDKEKLLITHLDSHRIMKHFIITLYPKKERKIFQFWEMVYQEDSPVVIMINDTELHQPPYWPAQGDSFYGDNSSVTTKLTQCDPTNTFYIREIDIKQGYSKSAAKKSVMHFQYISWPQKKDAPSVVYMLNFMQQIKTWCNRQKLTGSIIVHSANGVSRASLFCVLWNIIERLEEEGLVDIYRTTRYFRCFTTAAVTNLDQYRFLYKAVREQLGFWKQQKNSAAVINLQSSEQSCTTSDSQSSSEPAFWPEEKVKFHFISENNPPAAPNIGLEPEVSIISRKSTKTKKVKSNQTVKESTNGLKIPRSTGKTKNSTRRKGDNVRQSLYPKLLGSSNTTGEDKSLNESSETLLKQPLKVKSSEEERKEKHTIVRKNSSRKSMTMVGAAGNDINVETKANPVLKKKRQSPSSKESKEKLKKSSHLSESPTKLKANVLDEIKTKVPLAGAPPRRSRFTNYTMYPSSDSSEEEGLNISSSNLSV